MAKNVHIYCGYVEVPDFPGWYYGGFRVVIPDEFDQIIQCGEETFDTPDKAKTFAETNANTYLRLMAAIGVIDPKDIAQTFWEDISTN